MPIVKIHYTWLGDNILRAFTPLFNFICFLGWFYLVGSVLQALNISKPADMNFVFYFLGGGVSLFILFNFFFWPRFLNILSAYLYIRLVLKTKVSFLEARQLAFLFVPNTSGVWYPLEQVKNLPENLRRTYLFNFYNTVVDTHNK